MFEFIKNWIALNRATAGAIISCASGALFLASGIFNWKWLTELSGNEYRSMGLLSGLLYEKFGTSFLRIRNGILGIIMIVAGVFLFML